MEDNVSGMESDLKSKETGESEPTSEKQPKPILMVDTENMNEIGVPEKTKEIQALSNEIISTIRELINMNPFYK